MCLNVIRWYSRRKGCPSYWNRTDPNRLSYHTVKLKHGGEPGLRSAASLPVLKRMGVTEAVRASCYAYTLAEKIDQLIAALQKNAEDFYDG